MLYAAGAARVLKKIHLARMGWVDFFALAVEILQSILAPLEHQGEPLGGAELSSWLYFIVQYTVKELSTKLKHDAK